MGNSVTRAISYSISTQEASAIEVLELHGTPLNWFRLDDGVMGGQSETIHIAKDGLLHFEGTINTNGGGFTSIRAKIAPGWLTAPATSTTTATVATTADNLSTTKGLNIRYRGDGKTYKVLLSNGNRGGPFSATPSWQADLPTANKQGQVNEWDEATIPFESLFPAFGGGPRSQPSKEEKKRYKFDPKEMKEIGLMLSLRLSDGSPNPPETFGEGIFPFSLVVQSISTYN